MKSKKQSENEVRNLIIPLLRSGKNIPKIGGFSSLHSFVQNKNKFLKTKNLNDSKTNTNDVNIFIPPRGTFEFGDADELSFKIEERLGSFMSSTKPQIMLIVGEGGSGKSTLCQEIIIKMPCGRKNSFFVPIYFDLSLTKLINKKSITSQLQLQYNFNNEHYSNSIINHLPVLIILDAFDEINPYNQDEILEFLCKNCRSKSNWKFVLTCDINSYHLMKERFNEDEYELKMWKMIICKLNEAEIMDLCMRDKSLKNLLKKLNMNIPFFIRLITQLNIKQVDQKLSEYGLLDEFLKMFLQNRIKEMNMNEGLFDWKDMKLCCCLIAFEMFVKDEASFYMEKVLFNQEQIDLSSFDVFQLNEKKRNWVFFFHRLSKRFRGIFKNLYQIVLHLPLRCEKGNVKTFTFAHKLIFEYFIAEHIIVSLKRFKVKELVDNEENMRLLIRHLNSKLICSQANRIVLLFLKDALKNLSSFHKVLIEIVKFSRHKKDVSNSSSNAISILNFCGFSFEGMNLSNVKIPGANLYGTNLRNVSFIRADLRGVNFSNSKIEKADFSCSNMQDSFFGKGSSLMGSKASFSPDGKYFVICKPANYDHSFNKSRVSGLMEDMFKWKVRKSFVKIFRFHDLKMMKRLPVYDKITDFSWVLDKCNYYIFAGVNNRLDRKNDEIGFVLIWKFDSNFVGASRRQLKTPGESVESVHPYFIRRVMILISIHKSELRVWKEEDGKWILQHVWKKSLFVPEVEEFSFKDDDEEEEYVKVIGKWHPLKKIFACCAYGHSKLILFDGENGYKMKVFDFEKKELQIFDIAFQPSLVDIIIAVKTSEGVFIINMETSRFIHKIMFQNPLRSKKLSIFKGNELNFLDCKGSYLLAFGDNGGKLYVCDSTNRYKIFFVTKGHEIGTLEVHWHSNIVSRMLITLDSKGNLSSVDGRNNFKRSLIQKSSVNSKMISFEWRKCMNSFTYMCVEGNSKDERNKRVCLCHIQKDSHNHEWKVSRGMSYMGMNINKARISLRNFNLLMENGANSKRRTIKFCKDNITKRYVMWNSKYLRAKTRNLNYNTIHSKSLKKRNEAKKDSFWKFTRVVGRKSNHEKNSNKDVSTSTMKTTENDSKKRCFEVLCFLCK